MGRFFPHANREDIIYNFKNSDNTSYNSTFLYPKGGAIEYINSLYWRIPSEKVLLNERLVEIDLLNKIAITNKRRIQYDNIISSMPFPQLLDACSIAYNKNLYSWNKVLVFNLGFNKKGQDGKNHWVYFPGKEYCFYRIGYYDNIFSDNRMSLYVELGFHKDAIIDIESYKMQVLADLKKAGIIEQHELISSHTVIMDPAYVHIAEDSIENVAINKNYLSKFNIFSIGRYGGWTYCSIEDNMIEAHELVKKIRI